MNLVDNVNGGVLGGIGLAFFVYTAITMVQKIEEALTTSGTSPSRAVSQRDFTEYMRGADHRHTRDHAWHLAPLRSLGEEDLVVSMQDNTMISARSSRLPAASRRML